MSAPLEECIAAVKTARHQMDRAKADYYHQGCTYDDMAAAAKAYCAAFDAYHRAKFGKPKRLDFRAVLR